MASLPAIQEEYQIGKLYNITVNDKGRPPKTHKNMILQKIEEDEDEIYYEFRTKDGGGGMTVLQGQISSGYIEIKEVKENRFTPKPSLELMNLIKEQNRNLYTQTAVAPADRTLNTFGKAHPSVQEQMVYGNAAFKYGFNPPVAAPAGEAAGGGGGGGEVIPVPFRSGFVPNNTGFKGGKRRQTKKRKTTKRRKSRSRR